MKKMKSGVIYKFLKNEYPIKYGCEYPLERRFENEAKHFHMLAFIDVSFEFGQGGKPEECFNEIRDKLQTRKDTHVLINRLCQWYLNEQYSYMHDHEYVQKLLKLTSDSYEF